MKTDVAIIGAGPGGYVAAIRLAQLGKSVTLIDKEEVGGLCLQHGCIPSKALIHVAELFNEVKNYDKFGITINNPQLNFEKAQSYRESVIKKLTAGIKFLLKNYKIDLVYGKAKFKSSSQLEVDNKIIDFDKCIIATGAVPIELPNLKFNHNIIGSKEALELKEIPKDFIFVGGGYIGVELATAFAKLGSNVTIIELLDNIFANMDDDVIAVLKKRLEKLNIKVLTKSKITKVENNNNKLTATINNTDKLEANKILVSVGFKPNTKELNLEATKIKLDDHGFIQINKLCQTDDPNIFAIGDISGQPFLAHKSSREGEIAAEVIAGKTPNLYKAMPAVVFSDPEIAWVGLTEKDAKERQIDYKVAKFPFAAVSKSIIYGKTEGFVKMLSDKENKLLGTIIVGKDASKLIGEATLAIEKGSKIDDITETIHPHPTISESLMEAADYAAGTPLHIFDRKLFSKK